MCIFNSFESQLFLAKDKPGEKGETGEPGPKGDPGEKGEPGETGEQGKGFIIIGYFASYDDLLAGVPSPSEGDAYGIGDAPPYEIYVYDALASAWVNNGPLQGPQGEKGDKGNTGAQGPKGDKGDTGSQGPQGAQGPKGDKGDTGAIGPKGDAGSTGAQGPKGDTGNMGAQGPKGDKGDTGGAGPQGAQGPKGDTGNVGSQGPKGDTGATGSQGPKGDTGKSAYQSAVEGGYAGTESAFAQILAKMKLPVHASATLSTSGWTGNATAGYTYTVNNANITDGCVVEVVPAQASEDVAAEAGIYSEITASAGSLTLKARNMPTGAITIKYAIMV